MLLLCLKEGASLSSSLPILIILPRQDIRLHVTPHIEEIHQLHQPTSPTNNNTTPQRPTPPHLHHLHTTHRHNVRSSGTKASPKVLSRTGCKPAEKGTQRKIAAAHIEERKLLVRLRTLQCAALRALETFIRHLRQQFSPLRSKAPPKANHFLTQQSKARKTPRPTKLRPSLVPGTILILLAGRFRGKRVVLLKPLSEGVLLVTGPFKANGVPLRRVNARYVIATSQKIDISSVDTKIIDKVSQEGYFTKDKADKKKGEEAFFKQGEKPEVCALM